MTQIVAEKKKLQNDLVIINHKLYGKVSSKYIATEKTKKYQAYQIAFLMMI